MFRLDSPLVTGLYAVQASRLAGPGLKAKKMSKEKRSAEQQVADEADRRALHPLTSRQTISDNQATPEFQANHKRLRADRLAREAALKAQGK